MSVQLNSKDVSGQQLGNQINLPSEDGESHLSFAQEIILEARQHTHAQMSARTKRKAENIEPDSSLNTSPILESVKKTKKLTPKERDLQICTSEEEVNSKLKMTLQEAISYQEKKESSGLFVKEIMSGSGEEEYDILAEKVAMSSFENLCVAASSQGRRKTMEDFYIGTEILIKNGAFEFKASFLGVFDGHNGTKAAQELSLRLSKIIEEKIKEFNPFGLKHLGLWNAIKMAFVECGEGLSKESSGSTAVVALILENEIWIANTGDSRAIFFIPSPLEETNNLKSHFTEEVISLTQDQKPEDEKFKKGIIDRGGNIYLIKGEWRVQGVLNCARAFGDSSVQPGLTCRPKITMIPKKSGYLLLASDGLFSPDVKITNRDVAEGFCHDLLKGFNEETAAKNLIKSLLSTSLKLGSSIAIDNTTVLIYKIKG